MARHVSPRIQSETPSESMRTSLRSSEIPFWDAVARRGGAQDAPSLNPRRRSWLNTTGDPVVPTVGALRDPSGARLSGSQGWSPRLGPLAALQLPRGQLLQRADGLFATGDGVVGW